MNNWIELYTDGACKGNPGPGGWGVLVKTASGKRELCGGEANTTNNRMELTAVIKGLESLTQAGQVRIITDSQYVNQGMTKWIKGWRRNGWRTTNKEPVKNRDLWEQLDALLSQQQTVEWQWVRGHTGNPGNEQADKLANQGITNSTTNAVIGNTVIDNKKLQKTSTNRSKITT